MFISTYLSIISSRLFSFIVSIFLRISSRYNVFANLKFPLEMFSFLIIPAKSYKLLNRYLCICCSPLVVPISILLISLLENSFLAFSKLFLSIYSFIAPHFYFKIIIFHFILMNKKRWYIHTKLIFTNTLVRIII